jgi:hypothetical protein
MIIALIANSIMILSNAKDVKININSLIYLRKANVFVRKVNTLLKKIQIIA